MEDKMYKLLNGNLVELTPEEMAKEAEEIRKIEAKELEIQNELDRKIKVKNNIIKKFLSQGFTKEEIELLI